MELTCWWNQLWIIFMNMKSITAARHEQHNISFLSSLPNGKKEEMLIAPPDAAPSQTAIEMKWNCGLFGAAATMGELVDELCFWFWVGYGRWHRQWLRPKEKTNNNSSISSSFPSLFSIWLNKEKIKLREKKKRGQSEPNNKQKEERSRAETLSFGWLWPLALLQRQHSIPSTQRMELISLQPPRFNQAAHTPPHNHKREGTQPSLFCWFVSCLRDFTTVMIIDLMIYWWVAEE